ncbi:MULTISPECIES: YciI family protein [unclassified Pseudactinotalea]|uniref:YciI family protein n=1 Tax=unclassified Pseudactinotalea TaxID=2649176 RepID=UPI00128AE4C9|nr:MULTISPECIES: YciI family protein [unclassified Pseudactinotalea]MPV49964.1 hypothetical protein [Pseudactinotalea sp. HY160]QGH69225.1 hypothetical protein GCE65_06635 [Pseudactinotalea sp. HY158]
MFVVTYTYDPVTAETADRVRPDHRAFLAALAATGELVASGPWLDGEAGALILLRADSRQAVLDLLEADPFRAAGVIAERTVREWNPVIGVFAE